MLRKIVRVCKAAKYLLVNGILAETEREPMQKDGASKTFFRSSASGSSKNLYFNATFLNLTKVCLPRQLKLMRTPMLFSMPIARLLTLLVSVSALSISSFAAAPPADTGAEYITDGYFRTGLNVKHHTTGALQGAIRIPGQPVSNPKWFLTQWNSKASIYGVTPTVRSSGAYQWVNIYKTVVLNSAATVDSDICLKVDSIKEYNNVYRVAGQPWPHLLLEQRFSEPNGFFQATANPPIWTDGQNAPWMSQLIQLNLNIVAKLVSATHVYTTGYNSSLHAAQYVMWYTLQNLNTASPDYGNFIWFGVGLYDDRYPAGPPKFVAVDQGTGKLMYNIGLAPFSPTGLQVGVFKTIQGDLLPHVKAAIQEAYRQGAVLSQNFADYKIGGMNTGWEVPGLSRVDMQIKDFSLRGYGLNFPKPYEFSKTGNLEGWQGVNLTSAPGAPTSGTWIFTPTTTDPQLLSPLTMVSATKFKKIKIRMMNQVTVAGANVAQLFWRRSTDTGFSEVRSVSVTIGTTGAWTEYTFDMTGNANWTGQISYLRFDPVKNKDGHTCGVDYIRFAP